MTQFPQLALSIVTIHKGNFSQLLKTCLSLNNLRDNFRDFEWLIVTDEPTHVKDFVDLLPGIDIRLISVQDSGPFDAMNKSVELIFGRVINFLNSGDEISPAVNASKLFATLAVEEFAWGVASATYITESGLKQWKRPNPKSWKYRWCLNSYCHQATFYNRDFLDKNGKFDSQSLIADWKTSVMLNEITPPVQINVNYCIYEGGGLSSHPNLTLWIKSVFGARRKLEKSCVGIDLLIACFVVLYLSIRRLFVNKIEKL